MLNNPWITGVGGGILSGLLVTLITRYLFSKRDNREYVQKVITANQEILYAIRPGISEGVVPSDDVLESLIFATALKYGVDAKDLHNASSFTDVLIKEVMDSSFLSASAKADFCQKLSQLRPQPKPQQLIQVSTAKEKHSITQLFDYRQRMIAMMSGMMGVIAALMTGVLAFSGLFDRTKPELKSTEVFVLVPTFMTISVVFVATYSMWMIRFLERKRKKRRSFVEDSKYDKKTTTELTERTEEPNLE